MLYYEASVVGHFNMQWADNFFLRMVESSSRACLLRKGNFDFAREILLNVEKIQDE